MADGLLHVPWSALWRPSADCVVCVQFVACGWLIPHPGLRAAELHRDSFLERREK